MDLRFVPVLADAMNDYFENREAAELCEVFGVRLGWVDDGPAYMALARVLISKPEHGNNHRLLEAFVDTLVGRARRNVANSSFERRVHHEGMLQRLEQLEAALTAEGLPAEINAPEDNRFTAKSKVREFLSAADTAVMVVDNYVGAGTLDCLRDLQQPIRLLTGSRDQCIENGFDRVLADFLSEGFNIEVRQHRMLHDRYVMFAERLWLLGSSLKDAGKKSFNAIEMIDGRAAAVADVEAKWAEADPYP